MVRSEILSSYCGEDAQAMVEYALILALVSAVVFGALATIGPALVPMLQAVVDGFV